MERIHFFRRKRQIDQLESPVITQMLGLSLFIMLLAFFIVLNSITSFDNKRVDPVIQSLQETFGSGISTKIEKPSQIKDPISASGEGDVISQISALLRAQIPSVDLSQSISLGVMRARVSKDDLETSVSNLTPEKLRSASVAERTNGSLLPMLAALLKAGKGKNVLRMDIVLNSSTGSEVDIVFLEKIAILLEGAGVPRQRFSIVYTSEGAAGTVDMVFLPYEAFSPKVEGKE